MMYQSFVATIKLLLQVYPELVEGHSCTFNNSIQHSRRTLQKQTVIYLQVCIHPSLLIIHYA